MMTEQAPEPASNRPFHPESRQPERLQDADLRRPLLIGCGSGCSVLIVLAMVLTLIFATKLDEMLSWALAMSEDAISTAAPDDWTDADAEALSQAFRAASEAMADGRADVDAMVEMNRDMMDALRKAPRGQLTRDDLLQLTRTLEQVAGLSRRDRSPGDIVSRPTVETSCLISS